MPGDAGVAGQADGGRDVAHGGRAFVLAGVADDEVEDGPLALADLLFRHTPHFPNIRPNGLDRLLSVYRIVSLLSRG